MRCMFSVVVFCVAVAPIGRADDAPYCKDSRYAQAARCFVALDNGGPARDQINLVYVDNASSFSNERVADLVLSADRSTQNGNPTHPPYRKGLMKDQDRVCVTDRYLAWFDYSIGDGAYYDSRVYGNDTARDGTLTGLWTLDPVTADFRFLRPSPDGSGGRWAHNELIPGSASPNGEQYWWDPSGPPVEHTFVIPTTKDPDWSFYLFSYQYARSTPKSGWAVTPDGDGRRDAEGVHYKTTALMTSWKGKVDVVDGEDVVDIKNSVQASLEYICRPDDIVMVWRFRPEKADIVLNNIYTILWDAYTSGIDGTTCDFSPLGNQWPGPVYGQPLYGRSSETLADNIRFSATLPGGVVKFVIQEPPCNRRRDGTYPDYFNNSVVTTPGYRVRAGSWMELSEAADLSGPGARFTVLDEPLAGAGSENDPEHIAWHDLGVAHENADGTIVFGCASTNEVTILRAGRWYQSSVSIHPLR